MIRFATLAATAALLALPATAQTVTMRVSHQVPPAHHMAKMVEGFAAEVKQKSAGQIDVQIFAAEQAFKAQENFPAVAKGSFEAALAVNFQWGNTIPEMNFSVVPYFFTDLEKIKRFPGSEAAKLLEAKLAQKGVRNLAWLYITRQSIFTSGKKPLTTLEDFKGLKIRGLNKLADTAFVAIGAAPSAMPGSEVYQGLQSGVLDAGLTDLSAAYSRKYFEVQKYGTVAPYFSVYFHMYVNPAWWGKLSAEHKAILETAARNAEAGASPLTEKTAEDAIVQLKEKGMVLHMQSAAEARTWAAAMQKPVLDEFLKAAPTDGPKLIELMGKL